ARCAAQPPVSTDSATRLPASWMPVDSPPDRRVRVSGSTAMIAGAGPARPTAPAAQPSASPSGRTLIARSVDLSQPIPSMPPGRIEGLKLREAPTEPTDVRFPINLATALRLADARPLIVAAAQASVWVAEARLQRARVLWVPSIMTGFDYIRHDGGGPD